MSASRRVSFLLNQANRLSIDLAGWWISGSVKALPAFTLQLCYNDALAWLKVCMIISTESALRIQSRQASPSRNLLYQPPPRRQCGSKRLVAPPPSEKPGLRLLFVGVSPKVSKNGKKSDLPPYDGAAESSKAVSVSLFPDRFRPAYCHNTQIMYESHIASRAM